MQTIKSFLISSSADLVYRLVRPFIRGVSFFSYNSDLLPEAVEKSDVIDFDIIGLIESKIVDFKSQPSHIHLHPKVFSHLLKEIYMRTTFYTDNLFKSIGGGFAIYLGGYNYTISFIDHSEPIDTIIVGDSTAYYDYVIKREFLAEED